MSAALLPLQTVWIRIRPDVLDTDGSPELRTATHLYCLRRRLTLPRKNATNFWQVHGRVDIQSGICSHLKKAFNSLEKHFKIENIKKVGLGI